MPIFLNSSVNVQFFSMFKFSCSFIFVYKKFLIPLRIQVFFMSFGTCFSIQFSITAQFQHFFPEFQVGNLNDFFLNEVNQKYFVQIVNGVNTSLNRQKQNNRKKCDMNDWTPLNTSKPLQFFSITFKNNFIKKTQQK